MSRYLCTVRNSCWLTNVNNSFIQVQAKIFQNNDHRNFHFKIIIIGKKKIISCGLLLELLLEFVNKKINTYQIFQKFILKTAQKTCLLTNMKTYPIVRQRCPSLCVCMLRWSTSPQKDVYFSQYVQEEVCRNKQEDAFSLMQSLESRMHSLVTIRSRAADFLLVFHFFGNNAFQL